MKVLIRLRGFERGNRVPVIQPDRFPVSNARNRSVNSCLKTAARKNGSSDRQKTNQNCSALHEIACGQIKPEWIHISFLDNTVG